MADDREVGSGAHWRGQYLSQSRVALGGRWSARTAAHFLHFLGAPEEKLRRFHGSAERAGKNALDRDAKVADRRADRAGVGPTLVDEVALAGAILVALHPLIVLAEIGRRVTEVEDVAAFAQFGEELRRRRLARRERAALRFSRL